MKLEYQLPSENMRSLLTVHAYVYGVEQPISEMLPAMLPNLYINLGPPSDYEFEAGKRVAGPRVALIGPTASAYRVHLRPGAVMITAGILPLGWMALMSSDGEQCADGVLDAADVWGPVAIDRLLSRLMEADRERGFLLVEIFLRTCMEKRADKRMIEARIIDDWLEHSDRLDLDELMAAMNICGRQVRRITLETHGATPKTLAMKYRCLRAAAQISVRGEVGFEEALPHYADQAHLIRDFRRFVGWTPGRFMSASQHLAGNTLYGRRRAGAVRPLVLLS